MRTIPTLPTLIAAAVLLAACGSETSSSENTSASTATAAPTTTEPPTTIGVPTTAAISTTPPSDGATTTTAVTELEQPAIWPAPDVVFTTPEEAAADFVTHALGVDPVLGDFQQGDSRSGEIEVFSPGEGASATRVSRGLLLLRQLGPSHGWFVTGAVNDEASITTPRSGAVVDAAPLAVEGVGHGFEATIVVSALLAGDAETVFDLQVVQAGTMETAGPFNVMVDLVGTEPGDMIVLLVQGGTGLETDPGEFGAIPVVIAG